MNRSRTDPRLLTRYAVDSTVAEAYRALRTNLAFGGDMAQRACLVVTSDDRGEGKSLTCANLGIIMSRTGQRVVLVDADLRLATLHERFGVEPGRYAELLDAPADLDDDDLAKLAEDCVVRVLDNLWLLPAGHQFDHPSELLGSRRFEQLIEVLRDTYDVILLDTPPVGLVADAAVVASIADGVVVVIDFNKSARRRVSRSIKRLRDAGADVIGTVLNRAPMRGARAGDTAYGRPEA